MYYTCPICGYNLLDEPPYIDGYIPSHNICDCCGAEFGLDDCTQSQIEKNRKKWIEEGCQWFNTKNKPENWDPDFTKLTPAERQRVEQAEQELENGEFLTHDEVWKDI